VLHPPVDFTVDCSSSSDSTERPLNDVHQPVMRRGPLWIVEPPLSIGERMSANDPDQPFDRLRSGRSKYQVARRMRYVLPNPRVT
jgi:hypothetical protein